MARPNNAPSFWQQAEHMQWLTKFPALTVMVFLRPDLGYRLLNPLHLMTTGIVVTFAAAFIQSYHRTVNIDDLLLFLLAAFALGICQRVHRWRQMERGVCQHSYYIGTSPLDFRWLPAFCRRNRRVARFADPAFCVFIGLALQHDFPALSIYIVFAGICLRGFEDVVHRKELNRDLDTVDGLIVSEDQGHTVEKFERPPPEQRQRPTVGIPTGLAPDVRENMKRRKAK
jgi:hypothetical protein